MTTDDRLAELERLCAAVEALHHHAAGRGWRVKRLDAVWSVHHFDPANPNNLRDEYDLLEDPPEAVCRLLVEARTALPALAAEVRRVRALFAEAAVATSDRASALVEREACAKVIDERADDWKRTWEAFLASGHQGPATSWEAIYRDMAAAIRARGQAAT